MRLTYFADDANVVFHACALEGIDRVAACSPVETRVTTARVDVCNPISRQYGDTDQTSGNIKGRWTVGNLSPNIGLYRSIHTHREKEAGEGWVEGEEREKDGECERRGRKKRMGEGDEVREEREKKWRGETIPSCMWLSWYNREDYVCFNLTMQNNTNTLWMYFTRFRPITIQYNFCGLCEMFCCIDSWKIMTTNMRV